MAANGVIAKHKGIVAAIRVANIHLLGQSQERYLGELPGPQESRAPDPQAR